MELDPAMEHDSLVFSRPGLEPRADLSGVVRSMGTPMAELGGAVQIAQAAERSIGMQPRRVLLQVALEIRTVQSLLACFAVKPAQVIQLLPQDGLVIQLRELVQGIPSRGVAVWKLGFAVCKES